MVWYDHQMHWISSFDFCCLILSSSWGLFICLAFLSLPVSGIVVWRDCTSPNTPSRVPRRSGLLPLAACILLQAWADPAVCPGYLHFRCRAWSCSVVCVTRGQGQVAMGAAGGHRRSWWPQVELRGRWLLSAVLPNAANQGLNTQVRGEPFSRASFKCPMQLYITLKSKLLPSFLLLPPPHPLIRCAALIFFLKKGCIWQPHFQRRPEILVMFMTKHAFTFFSFCYYGIKAKGFPLYIFNCVVSVLLTLSVNIIWRSFRQWCSVINKIGHFKFCLLSLQTLAAN